MVPEFDAENNFLPGGVSFYLEEKEHNGFTPLTHALERFSTESCSVNSEEIGKP